MENKLQNLISERDAMKSDLEYYRGKRDSACSARECVVIDDRIDSLEKKIKKYDNQINDLSNTSSHGTIIDKYLVFTNIRELLKTKDVKIGQIEKEAGCQLGYMSRLEKPGNNTEPSISFVATAARMFGVSIDILLNTNLEKIGSTEKYILEFIEKLKNDTLKGKLEWRVHPQDEYNNLIPNMNGTVDHPLFSLEVFDDKEKNSGIADNVFVSYSFGKNTYINDNCYSLKLKNNSILYLMDIKERYSLSDDETSKEIWLYVPSFGKEFLASTYNTKGPLRQKIDEIFKIVNETTKSPNIKRDIKNILDSYMNDDFTDEPDELPF